MQKAARICDRFIILNKARLETGPLSRPARVRLILLVVVLAVAAGATAYVVWPRDRGTDPDPPPVPVGPAPDPRLTFDTPFRNVRPDVQYVGDAACAVCHKDLTESYHRHAMGRSAILPTDPPDGVDRYDPSSPPMLTAFGHIDYRVAKRGETFVHSEVVKDTSGREAIRTEASVVAGIGSGTRGRSYLCIREGALWQSAVSWFSEKQVWDVSPGFQPGRHTLRPIVAGCLFCHVNRVEPVAGTVNRFKEPLLGKQAAIGCERCHGPGALHVDEQTNGRSVTGGIDTSIVNPRHLPADLREDVCRQCHFQGAQRIDRRGRQPFDFRPGLPLDLFMTVYVRHPALTDYHKSVGQVEQTAISRCAIASGDRFGCTSCHDPHSTPAPAAKVDFYRQKCLACHKPRDCRETQVARQAKNDACTVCHMPKAASANIAHTAVTDHRILRRPAPSSAAEKTLPHGAMPIATLAGTGARGPDAAERARDLGIALTKVAQARPDDATILDEALRLLRIATEQHADDAEAWEALADALMLKGQWGPSSRAADAAVEADPNRESALVIAAEASLRGRRLDKAVEYARRAVEVNPGRPENRVSLGQALIETERYADAETELRAAVEMCPNHATARVTLAVSLHKLGRAGDARAELERATVIDPAQASTLRELFNRQVR